MTLVFLGVGGNIGDSAALVQRAFDHIAALPGVAAVRCSRLYRTTPVSALPQPDFVNAACSLTTTLTARELLAALQRIEQNLGKVEKKKDEPRPIDLDILLFGEECYNSSEMTIPHPRWKERLFVLVPLLVLTEGVALPGEERLCLKGWLAGFDNINGERVEVF